ncbi:unnamed protein product [Microthlaspi erraticum]|uniref:Uncharacterized protein n=1 Tax=Microthlaspi erraticum TaxID=1685480 RepID=A0A6D2IA64_9BRAS|nr:unnamed protein product [Microthlaspi erraticum]
MMIRFNLHLMAYLKSKQRCITNAVLNHHQPRLTNVHHDRILDVVNFVVFTATSGVHGHIARRCSLFMQNTSLLSTPKAWEPRTNFVKASPWMLESGAMHHIASDLANLSLHQPYTGGEEVVVGISDMLRIS